MKLKFLGLRNFRNYRELSFTPADHKNILYGKNASGKTNVLEAISLLVIGRGFKSSSDRFAIEYGQSQSYIHAKFEEDGYIEECGINLNESGKLFYENYESTKYSDFVKRASVVIFTPDDLDIIDRSPASRRAFLDDLISYSDYQYAHFLGRYKRVLNERNKLLKMTLDLKLLDVYDRELAKYGSFLVLKRLKVIRELNILAARHFSTISSGNILKTTYLSTVPLKENLSEIEENFLNFLKQARSEDLKRKNTSVGIHRDDLDFKIDNRSAKLYGSQGEKRTVVISLKLAQRDYYRKFFAKEPILLLDDILAELDALRSTYLLKNLGGSQSFITSTERINLPDAALFSVDRGRIKGE